MYESKYERRKEEKLSYQKINQELYERKEEITTMFIFFHHRIYNKAYDRHLTDIKNFSGTCFANNKNTRKSLDLKND